MRTIMQCIPHPHKHNRDYVNDTAVAFPELGRTSTEVKQSQVILTFIQAMKVCDAILHSSPNSKSIVSQVPGFCLPRFTKLASDLILANPARESNSFFKCNFAESDMACPYDHILLDGHSNVLSVANRARIERTTEAGSTPVSFWSRPW